MAIIQINYMSQALGRTVPVNVILPADRYDFDTDRYLNPGENKYKTLFLLHGLLGSYIDWISETRIHKWAMERDLAVIMPSGDNSFYIKGKMPFDDYETFIGKELPMMMRRMFPLSEKREDTYIAGLSMGGYGALRTGMVYSDTFSHVAGLSSAIHMFDEEHPIGFENDWCDSSEQGFKTDINPWIAFDSIKEKGQKEPRFYLSCGREDDLFPANIKLRDYLIKKGADVTWDEDEKAGHEWDFWDAQIEKVLDWLP